MYKNKTHKHKNNKKWEGTIIQNKTLIDDILIYLPNWTNKPIKHHHHHHHHHHNHHNECPREVPAFIDEFSSNEEIHQEFDYRKHISNEEILHHYRITRVRIANWLNRKEIPHTIDCYNASCMWTAGVLEQKYKFKGSGNSRLINEAKEILEPYINIYFRVLNGNKKHPPHIHKGYNNKISITCKEVFECLDDTNT